jgi:hypothetical protein
MIHLDPPAWSALFAGISASVVTAGAIVAIRQLRIVAKTSRLQAYESFIKSWRDTRDSRRFVLEQFTFDPENPPDLESIEGEHLRTVVNNVNEIGFMVERRLLPPHYVLSLCYADLIRLDFRLTPYLRHRENQLGIPYGRRVHRMAIKGKRYMCAHPTLRTNVLRSRHPASQQYVDVYNPDVDRGSQTLFRRARWYTIRTLARY